MQKAQTRVPSTSRPTIHSHTSVQQFSTATTRKKPANTAPPVTPKTTRTKKPTTPSPSMKMPKDGATATTPKKRASRAATKAPDSPTILSQDQVSDAIKAAATPSASLETSAVGRRTSTKKILDVSVAGSHENTHMPESLVNLTRKMTKSDDHQSAHRKFVAQQPIPQDVFDDKNALFMTTWNVAGFRGALKNGFWDKVAGWERQPDILCLQEMKIQQSALDGLKDDEFASQLKKYSYGGIYNLGDKAGYSGVGVFYNSKRLKPEGSRTDSSFAYPFTKAAKAAPTTGLAKFFQPTGPSPQAKAPVADPGATAPQLDQSTVDKIAKITGDKITDAMRQEVWSHITEEGRILTVDFGNFFVVTTYVPNSGAELDRLQYRYAMYEPVILEYLMLLQNRKPVLYNGDLNAARDVADVHTPSSCSKSAGFQPEEIERINRLVMGTGLVDTFRDFQGDNVHGYTYWGHRFQGRAKDRGWRIDYWMVSESLFKACKGTMVTDEFKPPSAGEGRISDHAPLWVTFDGAILQPKV